MDDISNRVEGVSRLIVHNPVGYPPKVTRKQAARRLEGLDGKVIYLVDCRFDDSIELLKQVKQWFTDKMPGVETHMVSLTNYYGHDDPKLWEEIAANGQAAMTLLRELAIKPGRAVIVVTHDERIFRFADRIAQMADGHIDNVSDLETAAA